jgi:hypothetical protein
LLYERACSRTTAPSVPADRTSASGP